MICKIYRKLIALAEFTIESCRKDNTGIFISILLALFNYLVSIFRNLFKTDQFYLLYSFITLFLQEKLSRKKVRKNRL